MRASEAQIKRIEEDFAEQYAHWDIRLPAGAAARREAGHIFQRGWHIGYIWGEKDGEEYFEYLAQHRMTNDRHNRAWVSGRQETLDTADGFILLPPGATEAEISQLEHEHAVRSRAISAELRAKGLLPPAGENLGALEINEFLHSGRMANDDRPASGTSSGDS